MTYSSKNAMTFKHNIQMKGLRFLLHAGQFRSKPTRGNPFPNNENGVTDQSDHPTNDKTKTDSSLSPLRRQPLPSTIGSRATG